MANTALMKSDSATVTHGFGQTSIAKRGETAAQAMAASAVAQVQARYVVARQNTRSIDDFRVRLLHDCKDPDFAWAAVYVRPVGKEKDETGKWVDKFIKGPSIRMIETAVRYFTNMHMEAPIIYENDELLICRATAVDLEANIDWTTEFTIHKTIEKKGEKRGNEWLPPKGRVVIGERINSYGDPVYICEATEAETQLRMSAQRSKDLRTNVQRMLPKYVLDAAQQLCLKTREDETAKSPDAAKQRMIDSFAELSVMPTDLELFLGHKLERITPAEITNLRGVYQTIKQGEFTWAEAIAAINPEGSADQQKEVRDKLLSAVATKAQTVVVEPPPEPKPAETTDPDGPPAGLAHLEEWPDDPQAPWYWIAGKIFKFDGDAMSYREHSEKAFVAPVAKKPLVLGKK